MKQTIYQKIPVQIYKHTDTKHRYPPWVNVPDERVNFQFSDTPGYAVHGIQLYILQNSQLIQIYQEIPVQINRQLSPLPHSNLPEH